MAAPAHAPYQPATAAVSTPGPQAGYETLSSEVDLAHLPVEGAMPPWLKGSLLRNGPALFEDRERSVRHWFDGQAMLHRFAIEDGNVSYRNRLLRTKQSQAMRSGRLSFSEFATDPCRSIFKRLMTVFDARITDNAAVSLATLGQRHYAMTEAPLSVQFDPQTLETLGYGERSPGDYATAHPHRDPATGAIVNIATRLGARNSYRFFVHPPDAPPRVLASTPVKRPAYIHSFAMTDRFLALVEFPFTVNPIEIPLTGRPFIENFRWEPSRGTQILVLDRHTGAQVGRFETEPGFAFHHVGAWERGETLVMEYCDHETPAVIDALYLDRLRGPARDDAPPIAPRLRRVEVDLASGSVSTELRSDHALELPRMNDDARYLREYRFVYGVATRAGSGYDTAEELVKIDNSNGESLVWCEPGAYVGEPVFVPAPHAREEDDGIVLSVVLDAARGSSLLLVLDARTMTELARARAPHVIPHGLHGAFHSE